jgi:hypothetical protein
LDDILEDEKNGSTNNLGGHQYTTFGGSGKKGYYGPQARKGEGKLELTMQTKVEGVGG